LYQVIVSPASTISEDGVKHELDCSHPGTAEPKTIWMSVSAGAGGGGSGTGKVTSSWRLLLDDFLFW